MAPLSESILSNTAIVLVPGSFTPPEFYTFVSKSLITSGFKSVRQCQLLSACPANEQRTPPATLADDALYIREVLQAFIAQGKDVVMVVNSYAGFPGTEAVKGLPTRSSLVGEAQPGQQGALVGLIYLCSFLPLPGDSSRSVLGDAVVEPMRSGVPGGYMTLPDGMGEGIFSEWAAQGDKEKDVEHWFGKMITHSSDSFDGKVTYDIWSDDEFKGNIIYVLGEKDVIVSKDLSHKMIEKVEQNSKSKIQVKVVEGVGHVMHVTKPDAVVEVIEELLTSIAK